MPLIDLKTTAGFGAFHYTLSTPTDANAEAIVEGTPTLVLIHPIVIGSEIFHPIYADARLRRFNLLTLDLRGHGTTSASVEDTYGPETAARDVLNLMDALKIPASHLMCVSMGSYIVLQMTILAPERVLSLFMFSPLPQEEPPEIIEGRQEIWDCWIEAFSDPQNVDTLAFSDSLTGGLQYAWNNCGTRLSRALVAKSVPAAIRNWAPEHFDLFHTVTVMFFLNREPLSVSTLARIRCPVALVHCSEDIAYPIHHAQELLNLMQSAGVDAQLLTIDCAPHYGNVTHFRQTNKLLYKFLLASCKDMTIPPVPPSVESPFLAELLQIGLQQGDEDSDSGEEDSLVEKVLKRADTNIVQDRL
ncbi:Alpha/Beta hydrolase protein [Mycena albidolilacea]|uniref:Alpha/Beta hydrolase protein n=1 Tax=Mycena albidolilacea TaxID=1033008 RepID=A0AAD7F503_9AGAR|nr:Alpha/Beta hydrolase protein [Mycena albidolilacea]